MPKRSADNNYNTNLASEYLMMSLLNRAGKDAYLSLGNKKGVDIIVMTKSGAYTILEVKGVNKKTDDWLIGNSGKLPVAANLFYALVSFESQIKDLTASANFWIIPSILLAVETEHKISKTNNKTVYLSHKLIKDNYKDYCNTLQALEIYLENN
jgi:hypothetical protein